MTFPFEIDTVLLCDGIRVETAAKVTILGVLSGALLLPTAPALVPLSVFIVMFAKSLGKQQVAVSVKLKARELLRVNVEIDVKILEDPVILPIAPPGPLFIENPGRLTVELIVGAQRKTIKSRQVRTDPTLPMPVPSVLQGPAVQSPTVSQEKASGLAKRRPSGRLSGGES